MAVEQSYCIASSRDFRPGAAEIPFNNVAGHPYLQDQGAAIAVFNRYGSGRILKITDFFCRDISAPNSTAATRFMIQKVTGWTLGGAEDKSADTIKWDSGNADLPSQVKMYEDVEAVTGGSHLRTMLNLPLYNEVRALAEMTAYLHADKDSGLNNACLFRAFNVNGGVIQPIVLREGEGVCMVPDNALMLVQNCIKYAVNVFFRDASSGECYMSNFGITPDGGRVSWLLINGSGSGKVYQVYGIEIAETGNDVFPNMFSLEKIEALDVNTGIVSDIASYDSTNEDLTGKIDYRRDCCVTIDGLSKGAIMASPKLFRDWQTSQGGAPYGSGTMSLPFGAFNANFGDIRKEASQWVLREGQGVAIFKRTMSGIGKSGLFLRFTVSTPATGGGGATDYAFMG